jgi:hypothetical protein
VNGSHIDEFVTIAGIDVIVGEGIQFAKLIGEFGIFVDGMGQVDIPKVSL